MAMNRDEPANPAAFNEAIESMAETAKDWDYEKFATKTVGLLILDKGRLNHYQRTLELVFRVQEAVIKARPMDEAALHSPAVSPGAAGWIVANGDETKWRCWRDGLSDWTEDREQAIRYARREDAEAVHREDEDAWSIKPFAWHPTHRHKKRGAEYTVLFEGRLQVDGDLDNEKVVVYRGGDGATWVRPSYEFNDGRFEVIGEGGR